MNFMDVYNRRNNINWDWNKLLVNGKKEFTGTANEFFHSNFEIVEERKSLSEKRTSCFDCPKMIVGSEKEFDYREKDVKEAIKKFIQSFPIFVKEPNSGELIDIPKRAKEIFGERLTELK